MSEAGLGAIDATYRSIPPFTAWSTNVPGHELWQRRRGEFAELRETVDDETLRRARTVAMRAAAFETGAIEDLYQTDRGLTYTVATQAAAWEQQVAERAPDALALFAAQLRAYELVLDAATAETPVSEAFIRRLHEELTSPQETYVVRTPVGPQKQPLPRGEYKRHPNHVELPGGRSHAYAPVSATPAEMARLVSELRSDAFAAAHPALQAAYAHWALVAIHPFADGNGRVARALASIYFYRALAVPLLILADERTQYFDALAAADGGGVDAFVTLVVDAGVTALAMVTDTIRAAMAPSPERTLEEFQRMLLAHGDLTHAQLDAVAARLLDELAIAVTNRLATLSLPGNIESEVILLGGTARTVQHGFRTVVTPGPRHAVVMLRSAAPAAADVRATVDVFVETQREAREPIALTGDAAASGIDAAFAIREVHPTLTIAGQQRVASLAERIVATLLDLLVRRAGEELRSLGYE